MTSAIRTAVLGAALALPACSSTPSTRTAFDEPLPPPPSRIAGYSIESRPIDYRVWGDGAECLLVMASIHGNEPAGTPLVLRLERELQLRPELLDGRTVIIMPVVNPDGLESGKRTNARGVDLNRNFPAQNFRPGQDRGPHPLSEPESRAVHDVLRATRPDRIVSIHQPLSCIDYDGPAIEFADALGDASDLPVRRLGGRPGSLGSWAGIQMGHPIVTLELPGGAHRLSDDELWDRYGGMMLAAVEFR